VPRSPRQNLIHIGNNTLNYIPTRGAICAKDRKNERNKNVSSESSHVALSTCTEA